MSITDEGEYGKKQIDTLEMIWGEGYLSPGGASETVSYTHLRAHET